MADLLALSRAVIDEGVGADGVGPINRITHELSEIGDGIAVVEAFSHSILFETEAGLVAFDTSNEQGGERVVEALRQWSCEPISTVIYTHGHIDHVGGCGAFCRDAARRGRPRPQVVGHTNVARRFDRYAMTNGYNKIINERQFGQFRRRGYDLAGDQRFLPEDTPRPDIVFDDTLQFAIGGLEIELHHAKGETDDHCWAWIPQRRAICAGDFFIWNFPNAGNPQKVQRYPLEWAAALRAMAAKEAELFLPAHGLPIDGRDRIRRVLSDVADALEFLVGQTLRMMNEGARLNDILHAVRIDEATLSKPYLRPMYDEPEFVVRNIWRLYGGWHDGDPASLKPPRDVALASEIASLAGGARALAQRAQALVSNDPRLACRLVEYAAIAAPDDAAVHSIRAELYQARRNGETSLMAKGLFGAAANESRAKADSATG
jgi:alkyl sulfatase BDS1-like metallo-beta-lactamase superfamily hydrolase